MTGGRDAMILACLLPPDVVGLANDDTARLSAQFGISQDAVRTSAAKLLMVIRAARSTLATCQPHDAKRCPHCCGVLP